MGCTSSSAYDIVCNSSASPMAGNTPQGIIGKNLNKLMKQARDSDSLRTKIIAAIQKGELKRLRNHIETHGGPSTIDFTAIQGLKAEIKVEESLTIYTEAFTPVLMAVACN